MNKFIIDRCKASLRAGAIGDGLGAPYEINKLDTILKKVGPQGVVEFGHYDPGDFLKYAPCGQTGKGVLTDDTCMVAATMAGFYEAWNSGHGNAIGSIHQAYLHWGREQAWTRTNYDKLIDPRVSFPHWLRRFCFSSGAGKGTIAALDSRQIGTVEQPLLVKDRRSDTMVGNEGAGGMMRAAPVGWLSALGLIDKPYRMGCEVAAITHGGGVAQVTSGVVALLIAELAKGRTWDGAVYQAQEALRAAMDDPDDDREESPPAKVLEWMVTIRRCYSSYRLGQPGSDPYTMVSDQPFRRVSCAPADMLANEDDEPVFEGEKPLDKYARTNLFRADAVFIQTFMICNAAQNWHGTPEDRLRWALTLAVTQNGDSDTVGAIVGNILGAQLGSEAVNPLYEHDLRPISHDDIEYVAVVVEKFADQPNPKMG